MNAATGPDVVVVGAGFAGLYALHRLREETLEMKKALLLGRVDALGELLHQAWESKKRLDESISNSHVDRLYQLARREGAIGGKMPGAGGGGAGTIKTDPNMGFLVALPRGRRPFRLQS